ncbi:MAG TPA: YciI family protein [Gemmatimonadaceae bacterium]|nr:YciI family protein [Gemmatimonadaceae bacterium]
MRYLSIYKSPETGVPPTPEHMAAMGKLVEKFMKSGQLLSTEGCLPSKLGFRVRREGTKVTVKDGPFTEAKEVVGGFAIMRAESREEILALTHEFLEAVGEGECEIRQLYEPPA